MPTDDNLFRDLLRIADGEMDVAIDRLRQFESYGEAVLATGAEAAEPAPPSPGQDTKAPA